MSLIGDGLTFWQIMQGRKTGKQLKAIYGELKGMRLDQQKLIQIVGDKLQPGSTETQIVQATTDSLLNTPIKKIFVYDAGDSETIVSKDIPPTIIPPENETEDQ